MSTPLETTQLDFLRPYTLAYTLPSGQWHFHRHLDEEDVRIALELVIRVHRQVLVRHDVSGDVFRWLSRKDWDGALAALNLFYKRINDRNGAVTVSRSPGE
jgi:hypothetical protein